MKKLLLIVILINLSSGTANGCVLFDRLPLTESRMKQLEVEIDRVDFSDAQFVLSGVIDEKDGRGFAILERDVGLARDGAYLIESLNCRYRNNEDWTCQNTIFRFVRNDRSLVKIDEKISNQQAMIIMAEIRGQIGAKSSNDIVTLDKETVEAISRIHIEESYVQAVINGECPTSIMFQGTCLTDSDCKLDFTDISG